MFFGLVFLSRQSLLLPLVGIETCQATPAGDAWDRSRCPGIRTAWWVPNGPMQAQMPPCAAREVYVSQPPSQPASQPAALVVIVPSLFVPSAFQPLWAAPVRAAGNDAGHYVITLAPLSFSLWRLPPGHPWSLSPPPPRLRPPAATAPSGTTPLGKIPGRPK